MPSATALVLVVTDVVHDATLVCDMLVERFPNVQASTEPARFLHDFHRCHPQVLVLAFKTVAASERYYQNLFRGEALPVPPPYQTLLLCTKDEVHRAYEICRLDQFDDYVLFWPMVHDAPRLAMAVHLALRAQTNARHEAFLARIAAQARRITDLEYRLQQQLSIGTAHAADAMHTLETVQEKMHAAIDGFSSRMRETGLDEAVIIRDADRVEREFARLSEEAVGSPLREAVEAARPVEHWISNVSAELAAPLEAARSIGEQGKRLQPMLMVVDDDQFMRGLLTRVLEAADYQVVAVASATEALSALRRRPPDLIIMDVNLPDLNGIEVTRRLKLTTEHADIPVIMLTGQSERQTLIASRGAGAVDFVAKPFDREILLGKVSRHLHH